MATKLPVEEYLKFWEAAEAEEIGLLINCEPADQMKLVNTLFECRSTFGGYENLLLCQPKPEGTIFLVKKASELPA